MDGATWNPGLLISVLLACARSSLSWTGNVCENTECIYVTKRVCSYSTWQGCCAYKTVRVPDTRVNKFCCPGWSHNGDRRCEVPVCQPACLHGGTCAQPGKCTCLVNFSGPRCGQSRCSHLDPCYPGSCVPNSTRCTCTDGFSDLGRERKERCLKMGGRPEVFQLQANMSYWGTMKGKYMEMYSLLSDASGSEGVDFIWTNRKTFNRLSINASCQFSVRNLPAEPEYVSDSRFGIVEAKATLVLTKNRLPSSSLGRNSGKKKKKKGEGRFVSLNDTLPCDPKLTSRSPATSLVVCPLSPRFDRLLETGDILTVTFSTKSGGFRTLKNVDTGSVVKSQEFVGREVESRVEFRFDLEAPYHCSATKECAKGEHPPLSVQDLTKNPLEISWGGWQDRLSGMYRYSVEVFPLNHTLDNRLQILHPLRPLFALPLLHANLTTPVRYTPPSPGMLAVLLEVADRANNTRFLRRLALYDPRSDVTSDPAHRLHFTSASPAANWTYQNDTRREIVVSWEGVFRNVLHEDLGWLGQVEPYPPQLEDNLKNVPPGYDDHQGDRTVSAIQNRRGIVSFELAYQKLSQVGQIDNQLPTPPPSIPWGKMGLNQSYTVPESVSDGDTVVAWVRANDVMGNQLVRRTEVTFDETEAEVAKFQFNMNQPVSGIPFSSTFVLEVKDMQSGIAHVSWTFTRSNGTVIYSETVPGRGTQSCGSGDFLTCYCTPRDLCYLVDQSYSLSNCHMMVEKERLATEIIHVQVDISNAAGLLTTRRMQKGQLTMLNGTEAYYPPQNVRLLTVTPFSVTLTWDFPPSCYERTGLWVVVPDLNGQEVTRLVHKDERRYDLAGLQPDRNYTIQLRARYSGQVDSDTVTFTFRTAEKSGLTEAEKAGTAVGLVLLLLLLLLVLVLVYFARRCGVPGILRCARFQNWRNSLRSKRPGRRDPDSLTIHARIQSDPGEEPEELYLIASQTWQGPRPCWLVHPRCLALQDRIAVGKFADVYRASWTPESSSSDGAGEGGSGGGAVVVGKRTTVAAKTLKPGFSTCDVEKLMKKIEFFATEVGTHDNVLRFHGAVLDNQQLGPMMVLEFCETGQLDKWLAGVRTSVTEDILDKLFLFAKDIACGMDYLTSRGIVHSRLAARNVLLTFLLEVKVAGFGPAGVSGGRVPVKWASPELLHDQPATEKSDVWSYGVTLWEIYSMGKTPYPDVQVTEMGPYLRSGQRMDKPEYADRMFYLLMQNCWKEKPGGRPSFSEIKQQLCALYSPPVSSSADYYYQTDQLQH